MEFLTFEAHFIMGFRLKSPFYGQQFSSFHCIVHSIVKCNPLGAFGLQGPDFMWEKVVPSPEKPRQKSRAFFQNVGLSSSFLVFFQCCKRKKSFSGLVSSFYIFSRKKAQRNLAKSGWVMQCPFNSDTHVYVALYCFNC